MDVTTNIAVMMTFRNANREQERRCTLDFRRIKYLVEEKVER